jgi:hypothetical protein
MFRWRRAAFQRWHTATVYTLRLFEPVPRDGCISACPVSNAYSVEHLIQQRRFLRI